ncbi:hypothetical protein [Pelomonas sp. SE-A7]|uniref:hypothetical protein n=1 Tax=Pelomonas sp. SE-A7 TaxID=3054953 RepID=UPI00259C7BA5|nr:hypothetical protein [Pelomonas sp. SE-A7]MDM4764845.1 hypothetical protein [Pelomonas sp. SE-A7]
MVIKQVKSWFVARANAARWRGIADWADTRNGLFKQIRDGRGFVIELPKTSVGPLRVEWGPSQRSYISGSELRLRCELKLSPELQMMVLARDLMEQLETTVFEAYTDTLKTRVDTDTPEEMRWLVMFPKPGPIASKLVRSRFGAVGVNKDLTAAWIDGDLSTALAQASQDLLPQGRPFVMLTMRGNAYLRTAMEVPDLDEIQSFVKLMEAAAREARQVNNRLSETGAWQTTSSIAWQSQPPEDEPTSPPPPSDPA